MLLRLYNGLRSVELEECGGLSNITAWASGLWVKRVGIFIVLVMWVLSRVVDSSSLLGKRSASSSIFNLFSAALIVLKVMYPM